MTAPRLRGAFVWVFGALIIIASMGFHQAAHAQASHEPRASISDLQKQFSLSGTWRFKAGDNPAWAAPDFDDSLWDSKPIPGRWPAGGYPESGQVGWYRLTVKLLADGGFGPLDDSHLALLAGKITSAFEAYAGGYLLGGAGKLPPLAESDYDRIQVFQIPESAVMPDGRLVLALRVWGGDLTLVKAWGAGPYQSSFVLGGHEDLMLSGLVVKQVPGLLICVLFIGFGFYHLYLYRRNPQLNNCLWFGIMAINVAVYGFMLTQWKYAFDFSFITLKKIEFGSLYVFPAVVIQMLWGLLDTKIERWLKGYQVIFLLLAALVVSIPGLDIHVATLGVFQLLILPLMVLVAALEFRKVREGNKEAKTVFFGLLIFAATCVNDLLIDFAQVDTRRLMPFGFFAIMISMGVSLANKFTASLSQLEREVAERTFELSAANERLEAVARMDPLTHILNRRGFADAAQNEIQRVFRGSKPFSLVLMDIDHFKRFNDTYGHACGDHILVRVTAMLRERIRDIDRIARWGGEEFILLLPETDEAAAGALAEKLRVAVSENYFEYEDKRLAIALTFGVSAYRKGDSFDACVAQADAAMYRGKETGRNKVVLHGGSDSPRVNHPARGFNSQ